MKLSRDEDDQDDDEKAEVLLRGVDLFTRLDRASIRKLARLTTARDYAAGELMIHKGDSGLGMLIIVSGRARVFSERGKAEVTLAMLAAGDLVGEMSLIDAQPRSASVRAEEACKCLLLTRDSFHMLSEKEPEILWSIVPQLVDRLRRSDARITELTPLGEPVVLEPDLPAAAGRPEADPEAAEAHSYAEETVGGDGAGESADAEEDDEGLGLLEGTGRLMESAAELSSSLMLVSAQESFNLMLGDGPLAGRLSASRRVMRSVGDRLEREMSENARTCLSTGRGVMESMRSMVSW